MKFSTEEIDEFGLITFDGRLSAVNIPEDLENFLTKSIEEERINFILDLEKVEFVDSSGLSTLLTILTKSRNAGGETILLKVPDNLSNLLIVTKLNSIFSVADSMDSAKGLLLVSKN